VQAKNSVDQMSVSQMTNNSIYSNVSQTLSRPNGSQANDSIMAMSDKRDVKQKSVSQRT
jgi:hypothetical protein